MPTEADQLTLSRSIRGCQDTAFTPEYKTAANAKIPSLSAVVFDEWLDHATNSRWADLKRVIDFTLTTQNAPTVVPDYKDLPGWLSNRGILVRNKESRRLNQDILRVDEPTTVFRNVEVKEWKIIGASKHYNKWLSYVMARWQQQRRHHDQFGEYSLDKSINLGFGFGASPGSGKSTLGQMLCNGHYLKDFEDKFPEVVKYLQGAIGIPITFNGSTPIRMEEKTAQQLLCSRIIYSYYADRKDQTAWSKLQTGLRNVELDAVQIIGCIQKELEDRPIVMFVDEIIKSGAPSEVVHLIGECLNAYPNFWAPVSTLDWCVPSALGQSGFKTISDRKYEVTILENPSIEEMATENFSDVIEEGIITRARVEYHLYGVLAHPRSSRRLWESIKGRDELHHIFTKDFFHPATMDRTCSAHVDFAILNEHSAISTKIPGVPIVTDSRHVQRARTVSEAIAAGVFLGGMPLLEYESVPIQMQPYMIRPVLTLSGRPTIGSAHDHFCRVFDNAKYDGYKWERMWAHAIVGQRILAPSVPMPLFNLLGIAMTFDPTVQSITEQEHTTGIPADKTNIRGPDCLLFGGHNEEGYDSHICLRKSDGNSFNMLTENRYSSPDSRVADDFALADVSTKHQNLLNNFTKKWKGDEVKAREELAKIDLYVFAVDRELPPSVDILSKMLRARASNNSIKIGNSNIEERALKVYKELEKGPIRNIQILSRSEIKQVMPPPFRTMIGFAGNRVPTRGYCTSLKKNFRGLIQLII